MKIIFTLLTFSFSTLLVAQNAFVFESENIPYENLEDATSLNNGEIWDDPGYAIPLGFMFSFGEDEFDTLFISSDGTGGSLSTEALLVGGTFSLLVPVLQDIIDLGDFDGDVSLSNISFKTDGSEGNRILKLEYNNVGFFEDETGSDFINVQVWLFESDNSIEFRYGPSSILNPNNSYEGLSGLAVGVLPLINEDGLAIETAFLLENNPAAPDLVVIPAGQEIAQIPALEGDIPSGMVYRFIPQILAVDETNLNSITVFPNPTSGEIILNNIQEPVSVSVTNQMGQLISFIDVYENAINLSALPSGIYFLEIKNKMNTTTKKIVKK